MTREALPPPRTAGSTLLDLPLLADSPETWTRLAAANVPLFLADHAICEQQAALFALNLVAHYPQDVTLVRRLTALAAEEVQHLRRVIRLLHRRGLTPAHRRPNAFVRGLHAGLAGQPEPQLKVDRLLIGALIEARSCERFTLLSAALTEVDPELAALLHDLGPAEARHWRLFHDLAARELPPDELDPRWRAWLTLEARLNAAGGRAPTVHG